MTAEHPRALPIDRIDDGSLEQLLESAAGSLRLRAHRLLHAGPQETVQRMLIGMCRDTYFRAHRHVRRRETLIMMQGDADLLVFDAAARLLARTHLSAAGRGGTSVVEIPPGTWHTLWVRSARALVFEVKPGPHEPDETQAAAWAPAEGTDGVPEMLQFLAEASPGEAAS